MNIYVFLPLFFLLQFLFWLVGKKASKNIHTYKDYFLAGREVRLWPLTMTFIATQVGGGLVLGSSEEAYKYGWPVLFYPLGAGLGLLLLGCGIGHKLARLKIKTIAETFEVVYSSQVLKRIASLLSVISLFLILVAQIVASHKFLISLGIHDMSLFVAFWAIVIMYTVQGGLRAVISSESAQVLFFLIVFLLCFGWVYRASPSIQILQSNDVSLTQVCSWIFMPLLFMFIEQDMGQRCFAGGSPNVVSRASRMAGIGTFLICTIPVFFGMLGKTLDIKIAPGASVLMTVVENATGTGIASIVGCAVIAAILSTATAVVNAMGSNLSHDFHLGFLKKSELIPIVQGITCSLSLAAIIFGFFFVNIVDLLILSYELSVSCLFVPVFLAILRGRGHLLSAWFSVIFGMAGFILFRIYPIDFPKEIASLSLSMLGYVLGALVHRYKDTRQESHLEKTDA